MPTYSYFCPKCDQNFEAFHSMKCVETQFCPTCGGAGKKLMTASSIIFKGSGFYTTDYRDSGYVEAQKRDGATRNTPPGEGTGSSAKSEPSTPATGSSGGSSGGATAPTAPTTSTPASAPTFAPTPSPKGSGGGSSSGGGAPPATKSATAGTGAVARAA